MIKLKRKVQEGASLAGRRPARLHAFLGLFFITIAALGFRMEMKLNETFANSVYLSRYGIIVKNNTLDSAKSNNGAYATETADTWLISTNTSDAFDPENLQRTDRVPCGANKCFFPLKSDSSIGFLVAPSERLSKHQSKTEWFKTIEASWEFAEHLKSEHDIKHFLLGPPMNVTISHSLAAILNQNLWRESKAKFLTKERFPEGSTAFIQKVKTAPTPNLLFGCANSKVQQFQREKDEFIPLIKRKRRFARRFTKYLKQAKAMIRKEPCLIMDFQLLVDTKGRLYHLDLDRCFALDDSSEKRAVSKEMADSCFQSLDDIEASLLQSLGVRVVAD